jgi:hypothetical protein
VIQDLKSHRYRKNPGDALVTALLVDPGERRSS